MKELVERDGLFYKKFTDVPFTATTTTGEENESFNNGMKDDPWVTYRDNESLDSKGSRKDGKRDGHFMSYNKGGTVI